MFRGGTCYTFGASAFGRKIDDASACHGLAGGSAFCSSSTFHSLAKVGLALEYHVDNSYLARPPPLSRPGMASIDWPHEANRDSSWTPLRTPKNDRPACEPQVALPQEREAAQPRRQEAAPYEQSAEVALPRRQQAPPQE